MSFIRDYVFACLPAALAALLLAGCSPATPPDTRAADEAAIRAAAAEWSSAGESGHAEHFVSFYTDDVVVLPPNAPAVHGRQAALGLFNQLMAAPGFRLKFAPTKIEVARSGDVAYDVGAYELTMNDAEGNPQVTKGKYLVAWKKQADSSWKAAADMFSPDN